jgi:hypothetical protein
VIEAYREDNNTYAGMTLARLAEIDREIVGLSIASAGKQTYCVEATAGNSRAFKNGPSAEITLGSCSDPNSGKPYNPPPSEGSTSSSESLDAPSSIRAAIPAIEAYYYDHKTYTGMTVSKLREDIDAGLPAIRIVSAKKKTYCIEIAPNGVSFFNKGPGLNIERGHCPT